MASFEYNGMNWRTMHRGDAGDTGYTSLTQDREQYYDLGWRLVEERVRSDSEPDPMDPDPEPVDRHLITQYVWGHRGVDDIVLKRIDAGADGTYEHDFYHVTDALFSVVALLDAGGGLVERVRYEPYGAARHHWAHDVGGDGDADSNDQSAISTLAAANGGAGTPIEDAGYLVEADIDRSGLIDAADAALYTSLGGARAALGAGQVSSRADEHAGDPASTTGWAGYRFSGETANYLVRHRSYEPRVQRWLQRDPAGFVDGSGLYQYAGSNPTRFADPSGLRKMLVAAINGFDLFGPFGDLIADSGGACRGVARVLSELPADVDGDMPILRCFQDDVDLFEGADRWIRSHLPGPPKDCEEEGEEPWPTIVLIGHSYGGHSALVVAQRLSQGVPESDGFPVPIPLLITVDPIRKPFYLHSSYDYYVVPSNVWFAYNYYQRNEWTGLFWGYQLSGGANILVDMSHAWRPHVDIMQSHFVREEIKRHITDHYPVAATK